MAAKPCYFISTTEDSDEVITTECLKVANGQWQPKRTKRSENLEAARKLIPAGYHCLPDGGTSTIIIEWWISKPTWAEALKDHSL